jgi:hypothetical protein
MFETETLETVIKQSGILGTRSPSASGWHTVKCKLCNDYKARGGFMFENGTTMYHCFNCGHTAGHAITAKNFSKGMYVVLTAFDVDISAAKKSLFASFGNHEETEEEVVHRELYRQPPPLELPTEFEFINAANPDHADAIKYVTDRFVDYAKYGLMVSTTTNPKKKWYKRIIVPVYNRSNQVIFYQGRTYDNHPERWASPADPKANVLFGYHNLDDYNKDYVIICEGPFDMMSIDGIAILGSEFSPFHTRVLNTSSKKKIVVPQRDKRGYALALQALDNGYSLSFPDIGGAQDINDAIVKYGRLYTEQQIVTKTTSSKYEAQLKLGMWCST